MAPPGMPNMTSTPSDSSDRTSDCAPVTDSGATVLPAGAAPAGEPPAGGLAATGPAAGVGPWARTPAATVSGDGAAGGRGVGCSDDVFVMTVPSHVSAAVL